MRNPLGDWLKWEFLLGGYPMHQNKTQKFKIYASGIKFCQPSRLKEIITPSYVLDQFATRDQWASSVDWV